MNRPTGNDTQTNMDTDGETDTMALQNEQFRDSTTSKKVGMVISSPNPRSLLPKQSSGVTFVPSVKLTDTQQEIKLSITFSLSNSKSGNDIALFF